MLQKWSPQSQSHLRRSLHGGRRYLKRESRAKQNREPCVYLLLWWPLKSSFSVFPTCVIRCVISRQCSFTSKYTGRSGRGKHFPVSADGPQHSLRGPEQPRSPQRHSAESCFHGNAFISFSLDAPPVSNLPHGHQPHLLQPSAAVGLCSVLPIQSSGLSWSREKKCGMWTFIT